MINYFSTNKHSTYNHSTDNHFTNQPFHQRLLYQLLVHKPKVEKTGPSFARLPAELRTMTLNQLVDIAQQNGTRLTPCSVVCPKRQAVIEPAIFRSLKLTPERLAMPGFIDMVNRAANSA